MISRYVSSKLPVTLLSTFIKNSAESFNDFLIDLSITIGEILSRWNRFNLENY